MGEVRTGRLDTFDHFQCFTQVEMRYVLFALQGVEDQHFGAFEAFVGFFRNEIGIGDVTQPVDAKSQNGQFEMHDGQGNDRNAVYLEGACIDLVQGESGYARIIYLGEGVGVFDAELVEYFFRSVYGHIGLLHEVKGANVVQAGRMVTVFVGEDHGVDARDLLAEHLLAKIWSGIDHKMPVIHLDEEGGAQALIAIVKGLAYSTGAPDHWHTLGGTGAEKCDFQAAAD